MHLVIAKILRIVPSQLTLISNFYGSTLLLYWCCLSLKYSISTGWLNSMPVLFGSILSDMAIFSFIVQCERPMKVLCVCIVYIPRSMRNRVFIWDDKCNLCNGSLSFKMLTEEVDTPLQSIGTAHVRSSTFSNSCCTSNINRKKCVFTHKVDLRRKDFKLLYYDMVSTGQSDTNLHTVHKTTHRPLGTTATTPSAEHHMQ